MFNWGCEIAANFFKNNKVMVHFIAIHNIWKRHTQNPKILGNYLGWVSSKIYNNLILQVIERNSKILIRRYFPNALILLYKPLYLYTLPFKFAFRLMIVVVESSFFIYIFYNACLIL